MRALSLIAVLAALTTTAATAQRPPRPAAPSPQATTPQPAQAAPSPSAPVADAGPIASPAGPGAGWRMRMAYRQGMRAGMWRRATMARRMAWAAPGRGAVMARLAYGPRVRAGMRMGYRAGWLGGYRTGMGAGLRYARRMPMARRNFRM